MHNNELQSVQKIRNLVIAEGALPTIIFACKRGQSAHEIEINGEWHGAFTYYFNLIPGTSNITYKDGIKRINNLLKASGNEQISEIICREDVLEMKMNSTNIKGEKHCVMIFDMCRD